MAQIGNTAAFTVSDGQQVYFNVDTVNKVVSVSNSVIATQASSTTPDPGANGTIATAGIGIALVTPAAARTGIILQPGTVNGQECWVVNQGAGANSLTFAASGTSNVADGSGAALVGLTARKFVWIAATSLWYRAA